MLFHRRATSILELNRFVRFLLAAMAAFFQSGVAVAVAASCTGSNDFREERDLRVFARVGVLATDKADDNSKSERMAESATTDE